MSASFLLSVGVAAAIVATLSFIAKNEGIRGAGRIVGGISSIFIGWAIALDAAPNLVAGLTGFEGYALVACGVATSLFGLRKFLRRNNTQ
jgi:NAD/NADP transhydrogenase beta subunit